MSLKVISATVKSEADLKKVIEELRKAGLNAVADEIEKEFKGVEFEKVESYGFLGKQILFAEGVVDMYIKQMGIKDFIKFVFSREDAYAAFLAPIMLAVFCQETPSPKIEKATGQLIKILSKHVLENIQLKEEEIF